MPSLVWGREPQEAFNNPYEYEIQNQFIREADKLLLEAYKCLNTKDIRFTVDEKTKEKAIWLLQMDAVDSLRDALNALKRKDHRIAGQLFRVTVEVMDLAALFFSNTSKSNNLLNKWYENDIIPNREYRDYIKKRDGEETSVLLAGYYKSLSEITHRTYQSLLYGYLSGVGNKLIHDQTSDTYSDNSSSNNFLVLPHTISIYMAVLADTILIFASEIQKCKLIDQDNLDEIFKRSFETETIPRRFMPKEWLMKKIAF